jgi:hypothetical protein
VEQFSSSISWVQDLVEQFLTIDGDELLFIREELSDKKIKRGTRMAENYD